MTFKKLKCIASDIKSIQKIKILHETNSRVIL